MSTGPDNLQPNNPNDQIDWNEVQKILQEDSTDGRKKLVAQLLSWRAYLTNLKETIARDREETKRLRALRIRKDEQAAQPQAAPAPGTANVTGLMHSLGVTDAESKKLGRLPEAVSSADLAFLEQRILNMRQKQRVAEVRKGIFKTALKNTYSIDEDKWKKITSENKKNWDNLILNGNVKDFKLQNRRKAVRGLGYLVKGALTAATYFEVKTKVVVMEEGKKKKKNEYRTIGQAIELYYRRTIGSVVKYVESSVNSVVTTVKTAVMAGPVGKVISNVETFSGKVGHVVVVGADAVKVVGNTIGSAGEALLPAAAIFIATGGAIVPAAAGLGVMTITRTIEKVINDGHLSHIGFIKKAQLKYGVTQYKNGSHWRAGEFNRVKVEKELNQLRTKQVTFQNDQIRIAKINAQIEELDKQLKANFENNAFSDDVARQAGTLQDQIQGLSQELERLRATPDLSAEERDSLSQLERKMDAIKALDKNGGNVFSRGMRFLRAFNTGSTWGTIGAAICALTGVNPLVGGILGAAAGGGGRFIIDSIIGKNLGDALQGKLRFLAVVSELPLSELVGQIQTNIFIATQMNLLFNIYKGNLGLYLKENFGFSDSSRNGLENLMVSGSNYVQVGLAIPQTIALGSGILRFGEAWFGGTEAMTDAKLAFTLKGPQIGLGMAIGSAASLALLTALSSQLGITIGLGALIGVTVGAFIGATIATIALGVTLPVSLTFLAVTGLSFIGGDIFGYIGGKIDNILGKTINNLMGLVNAISAIFQLLRLLNTPFEIENLVFFALSMVALLQTLDKMDNSAQSNQRVAPRAAYDNVSEATPSLEKLSLYNIDLVNNGALPAGARTSLVTYLNANADKLHRQFPGKQIYMTTAASGSYESDSFVLLGVSLDTLLGGDQQTITAAINNSFVNQAQVTSNLQTLGNIN